MVTARVKCGETQANMSCDNGVLHSTIHGWLREKEKLHDFADTPDSTDWMKRKKARTTKDPQFDMAVFIWFVTDK